MHTGPLPAPNESWYGGGCPRCRYSDHKWSTNRVSSKQKRPFKSICGATTLPLRKRSQWGPQGFTAAGLDGLAGGTTPLYAPKTGRRPRLPPRSGGIGRPLFFPVTLRGPAGHAERGVALHTWPDGPAGRAQTPQKSLRHMLRPVGRSRWSADKGC